MKLDHLVQFLESVHPMPQALKEALYARLQFVEATRRKHLLKPNQISDRVYFIQSGVVCAYTLDSDKKRDVHWIMQENDVIISVRSFLTQKPGREYLTVLEDAELWSITYDDVLELRKAFPAFNWIYTTLLERYYIRSEEHRELLKLPAAEKYKIFVEEAPGLGGRVSQDVLSSYLGICVDTLKNAKTLSK